MIARRAWRSRVRSAETAWPRWRLLPSLSLYWRRRRAAPRSIVRVVRAIEARMASPVTALSVHQHIHRAPRIVRARPPVSLQAVVRITERLVRNRWLGARPLDGAAAAALAHRAESVAAAGSRAAISPGAPEFQPQTARPGRSVRTTAGAAEASQALRRLATRVVSVPRAELAEASPSGRPGASRDHARRMDEPARDAPPAARRHLMTTPLMGTPGARRAAGPLDVAPESGRSGTRQVTEVPLSWRTPAPAVASPRARPAASTTAHADPLAAPPRPPDGAASSAPGQSPARDITAAAMLDAGVVDRLADTVIQRIERRLRIERERRGL